MSPISKFFAKSPQTLGTEVRTTHAPNAPIPPTSAHGRHTSWLWISLFGGFSALFGGSLLALTFVHHRGVTLSGDEPSYVGEAYALGRLHTWNLGSAFSSGGFHRLIGSNSPTEQYVLNHGVQFPYHAFGFSAILAPALALVSSLGAVHLELLTLMSVLVIWLGVEITRLTHVPRTWLLLLVVLFLAPGYLLATTQVYPDLLSGLVLAIAIIRLMRVERNGPSGIWSSVGTGALLFAFFWLDDKNIVIGILVGTVAALVARRRGATDREVVVLIGLVLLGVVGVAAFNIYAYGRALGPTQVLDPFTSDSLTRMVALVFDRRHGILVQNPATLLGLVGAARWWRRAPWSMTVGIAAVAVALVANASLLGGMNGGSFVGRYEWEALPLALAFAGLLIIELVTLRRRAAAGVIGVLFLLAILESWALVTSRSDALSFIANGWDPATYLGWWGRLDPSPILNYFNGEWGNARNLWGLGALVALALAAALALARLLGGGMRLTRISVVALLTALLCWGMALASPFLLPPPIHYAASDLGPFPLPVPSRGITVSGPGHGGTILSGPNLDVLPGLYRVTVAYSLTDPLPHSATFEVQVEGVRGQNMSATHLLLSSSPATTKESVELNVVAPGPLSVNLTWHGSGRLTVRSVTVAKVSTCHIVECQGGWL